MKTLSILFLFFTAPAWSAPEQPLVNCRLICLQASPGSPTSIFAGPAEAAVRCDLPREELSRPVKLPIMDGKIVFRTAMDAAPIAIASIPAGKDGGLLLFLPSSDAETEPAYKVLVLDDSATGLPTDGSLVFNACPANLRFLIGEQRGTPTPGQITSVKRPQKRNEFQMCGVSFQIQSGESWRTTYESMLRFPENQHRLFVAFIDPMSKLPGLRVLRFSPR